MPDKLKGSPDACTSNRFSSIFMQASNVTWCLHELEVFICKAVKGEAIVNYASSLITKQMEISGSPEVVKIDEK